MPLTAEQLTKLREKEAAEKAARASNKIPFRYVVNNSTGEVVADGFSDFTEFGSGFTVNTPQDGQIPNNLTIAEKRSLPEVLADDLQTGIDTLANSLTGEKLIDIMALKAALVQAQKDLPLAKYAEGALAKIKAFTGFTGQAEAVRQAMIKKLETALGI